MSWDRKFDARFAVRFKAADPPLPAGDPMLAAFEAEIKEVVACLKNNKPSTIPQNVTLILIELMYKQQIAEMLLDIYLILIAYYGT